MTHLTKITSLFACSGLLLVAATSYAAPADLDPTFDGDGRVTNAQDGNASISDIVIQQDGKIVAAGTSAGDFAVARYNTNGSLDFTFSGDGELTTGFGGNENGAAVALQSNGKIVVVGETDGDFALARYNVNGSLDNTFGSGGKVKSGLGGVEAAYDVAIQGDGKIVAVGTIDRDVIIVRYNTNGSLDQTFAAGGKNRIKHGDNEFFNSVVIQPDGKIIASGYSLAQDASSNIAGDFILARFNTNGSLDTTFGVNGEVKQGLGGDDVSYGMVLTPSGKILLAGNSDGKVAVARFNTNGSLDTSFGSGGIFTAGVGGLCYDIALDGNGRIILAGWGIGQVYDRNFKVVRVTSNGILDTTFNNGSGYVDTTFGQGNSSSDYAYAVAVQSDGKIVAAGRNNANFALARYSGGGAVTASVTNANSSGASS